MVETGPDTRLHNTAHSMPSKRHSRLLGWARHGPGETKRKQEQSCKPAECSLSYGSAGTDSSVNSFLSPPTLRRWWCHKNTTSACKSVVLASHVEMLWNDVSWRTDTFGSTGPHCQGRGAATSRRYKISITCTSLRRTQQGKQTKQGTTTIELRPVIRKHWACCLTTGQTKRSVIEEMSCA